MPLSIFISMLWIMYVQLLPTRLAPSIKRATLPFSVFFHLQNVSIIFLLIAANVNFGAKLLIYIGLTKHFTNYLHQNTIFIRAILHQNTIFYDGNCTQTRYCLQALITRGFLSLLAFQPLRILSIFLCGAAIFSRDFCLTRTTFSSDIYAAKIRTIVGQ